MMNNSKLRRKRFQLSKYLLNRKIQPGSLIDSKILSNSRISPISRKIKIDDILDKDEELKKGSILGFTLDGDYLVTYQSISMENNSSTEPLFENVLRVFRFSVLCQVEKINEIKLTEGLPLLDISLSILKNNKQMFITMESKTIRKLFILTSKYDSQLWKQIELNEMDIPNSFDVKEGIFSMEGILLYQTKYQIMLIGLNEIKQLSDELFIYSTERTSNFRINRNVHIQKNILSFNIDFVLNYLLGKLPKRFNFKRPLDYQLTLLNIRQNEKKMTLAITVTCSNFPYSNYLWDNGYFNWLVGINYIKSDIQIIQNYFYPCSKGKGGRYDLTQSTVFDTLDTLSNAESDILIEPKLNLQERLHKYHCNDFYKRNNVSAIRDLDIIKGFNELTDNSLNTIYHPNLPFYLSKG